MTRVALHGARPFLNMAAACALTACTLAPVEEGGPSLVRSTPVPAPPMKSPAPQRVERAPAVSAPPPAPVPDVVAELKPAPPAPSSAEMEARQVLELVAYASRIAGMTADEQRRELTAANQEHARDPGARSRLRLALLLTLPGAPISDDGRAMALLEPLAGSGAATPLRQFGALLHAQVSERVREHKRNVQLKDQIDGLRAIDRSLIERERGRK